MKFGKGKLLAVLAAIAWTATSEAGPAANADTPDLDSLQGYRGCVAHHLDDVCAYSLNVLRNDDQWFVALYRLRERLPGGKASWTLLEVVPVPMSEDAWPQVGGCYFGGSFDATLVALVGSDAMPGEWTGPARWAVSVDFSTEKIVQRDAASVSCLIEHGC